MQPTMKQSFDSVWEIQKTENTNERLHTTARVRGTRFTYKRVRERSGVQGGLKLDYSGAIVTKELP